MDPPSRLVIPIAISALALIAGGAGHAAGAEAPESPKAAESSPPAAGGGNGLPFTQDSDQNGNGTKIILPYLVDGIIGCGQAPVDIALNSTLSHIYLVCRDENTLCVLDSITRDVLVRIALGGEGSAVVADAYANKVYVADATRGVVTVVDAVLLEVTKTIPVGGEPRRLAIDPERRRLYVADGRARVVRVVDCRRHELEREIEMPVAPSALAVDPGTGRLIIVSRAGRTLTMVNTQSWEGAKTLDLPAQPGDVLMEPETGAVFVTLPAAGKVMVIDQDKLVTVDVGTAPCSLAFDRARGIVFVGDVEGRQVFLMDASSKEILQRVDIAEAPVRLVFDPSDRSVYVMPDEGNHVRKLIVRRPQPKSSLPSRSRRGPRLATKIVGGLVGGLAGAVGAFFRKAQGFMQITVEDDDYGARSIRTFEQEFRASLGGVLAGGRLGRYSGSIGWKHATIDRNDKDYETSDLVYDIELSLWPKRRSGFTLYGRRDVNDIGTAYSVGRRLVTETGRAEWRVQPWNGTNLILYWEDTGVEDEFDQGYFTATERMGAKLSQRIPFGSLRLNYEQLDQQGSAPGRDRQTERLDLRTTLNPNQNLRLDIEYRFQDLDWEGSGDTVSHAGTLMADYRRDDRFQARFNLWVDSFDSESAEKDTLGGLVDMRYYPIRTPDETWEINLLGRFSVTGLDYNAPATPSVDFGGGTLRFSAQHRTRTAKRELIETYEIGHSGSDSTFLDSDETHERARFRAIFRPREWCQLWGQGELRFRQRDQAGERDLITDADLRAGVLLDVPRRFDLRAEVTTLLTTDPYRPSAEATARIDGEWVAHDHRWDWGSDKFLVGLDVTERLNRWTDIWYLRYEYRARFTKLSLTTLDLRREWRSGLGGDSGLTEIRFGFRYDINQLTMRLEYIYRDAEGRLYQDRNYLMARIRRTF